MRAQREARGLGEASQAWLKDVFSHVAAGMLSCDPPVPGVATAGRHVLSCHGEFFCGQEKAGALEEILTALRAREEP